MLFRTFEPDKRLSPFVRFYWLLEPDGSQVPHRLLPGSNCDIIIQLGPPAFYMDGDADWKLREPTGFVEGLFTGHFFVRFQDRCSLIGIRFTCTGLFPFVRVPVREFGQQFVDLESVFGRSGRELIEKLGNNLPKSSIPAILNKFLLQLLTVQIQIPELQNAVDTLVRNYGTIPIRTVRESIRWSERRLERVFERHVGVSPERFAQILRVNHFISLVRTLPSSSLTSLSLECGYSDQAHLIRVFRKHTGLSPREYFKLSHPIHQALNSA